MKALFIALTVFTLMQVNAANAELPEAKKSPLSKPFLLMTERFATSPAARLEQFPGATEAMTESHPLRRTCINEIGPETERSEMFDTEMYPCLYERKVKTQRSLKSLGPEFPATEDEYRTDRMISFCDGDQRSLYMRLLGGIWANPSRYRLSLLDPQQVSNPSVFLGRINARVPHWHANRLLDNSAYAFTIDSKGMIIEEFDAYSLLNSELSSNLHSSILRVPDHKLAKYDLGSGSEVFYKMLSSDIKVEWRTLRDGLDLIAKTTRRFYGATAISYTYCWSKK